MVEPGSQLDITDEYADVMFEGSVDPILLLSSTGLVLRSNEAARRAFGADIDGNEFGVPTMPGEAAEVELLTPAGIRVAELRVGQASIGGEKVYVANLRDVTERNRVAQALRDFVSTASHEFRTPLFAIAGFAETLTTQWGELADSDRQRYITIMHRQARRLSRLTDDLLTIARLDGEALEVLPRRTSVEIVVGAVAALLVDLNLDFEVEDGLEVMVDPDHLEEMIINLLNNSSKYGEAPFAVLARRDGDHGLIQVVDHGTGVPLQFRDRMFDRFSRERSKARIASGTGLGLAIVHGLLERNGGSIGYEDTPGGGATFNVRLPLA